MKRGEEVVQIDPRPGKTTPKKSSLIRVES